MLIFYHHLLQATDDDQTGFDAGWRPYVSMGDVTSGAFTRDKLKAAGTYLAKMQDVIDDSIEDIVSAKRFFIDTAHVVADPDVQREWPDIRSDLANKMEMVLGTFGLACSDMIVAQSSAAFFTEKTQQTIIRYELL